MVAVTVLTSPDGKSLWFDGDEEFHCPQCPASSTPYDSRIPRHGGTTLTCVAEWCPLFAYYADTTNTQQRKEGQ